MNTEWIISANHNLYDYKRSFNKWRFIDWKQGNFSYNIGDIVYIYSIVPYQTISYKTEITKINLTKEEIVNDSIFYKDKKFSLQSENMRYIRLKLLESYNCKELSLENLMKNGLKSAPQGPIKIKKELSEYIKSVIKALNTKYVQ